MMRGALLIGCVVFLGWPLASFAQGNGPDEMTRQFNPGVMPPDQGAGQVERYNLSRYMVPLYANLNAQQFYYQEYEDKLDRWAKFGHRWPSAKRGADFQLQRIQNDYDRRMETVESRQGSRGWFSGGVFFGRFRK